MTCFIYIFLYWHSMSHFARPHACKTELSWTWLRQFLPLCRLIFCTLPYFPFLFWFIHHFALESFFYLFIAPLFFFMVHSIIRFFSFITPFIPFILVEDRLYLWIDDGYLVAICLWGIYILYSCCRIILFQSYIIGLILFVNRIDVSYFV